ncbi:MAG: Lrp/AsnC family transcriptional regulator [Synergistaceae bacterium]|jgi:Lrp/AsnC family leucine-responsive transcriptional regulator|nr:Lrp/AsnC family transcriptional regulator [Synergistaceae bacterium]
MNSMALDSSDWKILDELQENARIPTEELARKLGVSEKDAADRIRRLEEEGVITGYRAEINPRACGYNMSAMISVSTDGSSHDQIINDALAETPEVTSCWSITGASDFLLEAHVPSLEFLEELLNDLARHGRLTTSIVLPRYGRRRKIHPPRQSMTD